MNVLEFVGETRPAATTQRPVKDPPNWAHANNRNPALQESFAARVRKPRSPASYEFGSRLFQDSSGIRNA